MAAAEQTMQSQLAGPTIALLDDMPADLWTRLSNRLSTSTAAAAQVTWPGLASTAYKAVAFTACTRFGTLAERVHQ